MNLPRIHAALTEPGSEPRFVSVPRPPSGIVPDINFAGRRYRRTGKKTDGGWPVYVLQQEMTNG